MPNLVIPETPRMTAEDCPYCKHPFDAHTPSDMRICKLEAALAASQQEVERLKVSNDYVVDESIRRGTEIADLRASLALARRDGERLDKLEAWLRADPYRDISVGDEVYFSTIDDYGDQTAHKADTLRNAIDTLPSSPPPETTQGENNG